MSSNKEIEETQNDIAIQSSLEALTNMEGGKILMDRLAKDVESAMTTLMTEYATMPESELRARCANMAVNYNLLQSLTSATYNKSFYINELKTMKPAYEPEPEEED